MHRLTLFLAAVLLTLSACATSAPYSNPDYGGAYVQAAPMSAPVQVPVMTPGFAPGTPSAPVYTPAGAGLPEVGQPGQQGASVKRSPNTRVLDDEYSPKKEPGLWAADGAPIRFEVLDVRIDLAPPGHAIYDYRFAKECISAMSNLISSYELLPKYLLSRPVHERECFIADLHMTCAEIQSRVLIAETDEEYADMKQFLALSAAFKDARCKSHGLPHEPRAIVDEIKRQWNQAEGERLYRLGQEDIRLKRKSATPKKDDDESIH